MRPQGGTGFRRLIGVGALLAALLLVAVSITASGLSERQALLAERTRASELATRSTALRAEAYNLLNWQMIATLAMAGSDPSIVDPDGEAHRHFRESLTKILAELDEMATATDDPSVLTGIDVAREGFTTLGRLDQEATAGLLSDEPEARMEALRLITSAEIVQYQRASAALAQVAETHRVASDEIAARSDAVARRVQLLLVGLTATMITALAGLALWVWQGDRRRHAELEHLTEVANQDPLTGLANRREWDARLSGAMARCAATGEALSLVLIDLDHFKRFNDTYGHPAGDRHLQAVAGLLKDTVRRHSDLVVRLGGEEFALLLVGSSATDASRVVDRVRPRVPERQTLSAGVAQWNGTETAAELVARADLALYEAKAAGRDRYALAG